MWVFCKRMLKKGAYYWRRPACPQSQSVSNASKPCRYSNSRLGQEPIQSDLVSGENMVQSRRRTRWLWILLVILAVLRLSDAMRDGGTVFEWTAEKPVPPPDGQSPDAVVSRFMLNVVEGRIEEALDLLANDVDRDALGLIIFGLVDVFDSPRRIRVSGPSDSKVRVSVWTDMGPEAVLDLALKRSGSRWGVQSITVTNHATLWGHYRSSGSGTSFYELPQGLPRDARERLLGRLTSDHFVREVISFSGLGGRVTVGAARDHCGLKRGPQQQMGTIIFSSSNQREQTGFQMQSTSLHRKHRNEHRSPKGNLRNTRLDIVADRLIRHEIAMTVLRQPNIKQAERIDALANLCRYSPGPGTITQLDEWAQSEDCPPALATRVAVAIEVLRETGIDVNAETSLRMAERIDAEDLFTYSEYVDDYDAAFPRRILAPLYREAGLPEPDWEALRSTRSETLSPVSASATTQTDDPSPGDIRRRRFMRQARQLKRMLSLREEE